jgi:Holliday junction DNA helicase RuvA
MIAMLRGLTAATGPDHLVLDVGGVGYKVHGTASLIGRMLGRVDPVTLHISTIVREDAFELFGFETAQERDVFDTLRGVNRVGSRMALGLLSVLDPGDLARAVSVGDTAALARAPGVGKRTAQRLCLELKDKLPDGMFEPSGAATPAASPARPGDPLPLALARLDYRKSEIDLALGHPDVPGPDAAPVEERLRAALRVLAPSA